MTNPVNLTDLLQAIGHSNLNFQQLDNCLESVKAKQGVAMVTFGTEAISSNDAATDDMPNCIIIWVDRDLYQQRFQALQRGEGQTYGQLQAQLKGAFELLQEAGIVVSEAMPFFADRNASYKVEVIQLLRDRINALLDGQMTVPAIAVTETIRTAPERIWLQVGDQAHYHSEPFPRDTSEVSWCAASVVGCEVPYLRADLASGRFEIPITEWANAVDAPDIPEGGAA